MREKCLLIINMIILVVSLSIVEETFAKENQSVKFGTWLPKDRIENQRNLSAISALELLVNEERVLLYQASQSYRIYLSIFSDGSEEQILWQSDELVGYDFYNPWWIPVPALAGSQLNANDLPDLFVCYSIDCGNSQYSKCWKQYMLLLFDIEREMTSPIPLSEIQQSLTEGENSLYYTDEEGNQGFSRNSLVMMLPASEETSLELYVWSRTEWSPHPPSNTPASKIYKVVKYLFVIDRVSAVRKIEGTYQETSSFLRAIFSERRKLKEIPPPLLLNFLKKAPNYLCEENEWFRYLEGWE